eukprot:Skav203874  [mRNA]  locus=scaffold1031:179912:180450:- [translate_table: standard]
MLLHVAPCSSFSFWARRVLCKPAASSHLCCAAGSAMTMLEEGKDSKTDVETASTEFASEVETEFSSDWVTSLWLDVKPAADKNDPKFLGIETPSAGASDLTGF